MIHIWESVHVFKLCKQWYDPTQKQRRNISYVVFFLFYGYTKHRAERNVLDNRRAGRADQRAMRCALTTLRNHPREVGYGRLSPLSVLSGRLSPVLYWTSICHIIGRVEGVVAEGCEVSLT